MSKAIKRKLTVRMVSTLPRTHPKVECPQWVETSLKRKGEQRTCRIGFHSDA